MKVFIFAMLLAATLSMGMAGMRPAPSGTEQVERKTADLDGDGEPDLLRIYDAPTEDATVDRRCVEITLSRSATRLLNCKALMAQRGSALAWYQYEIEPGGLSFTHHLGPHQHVAETERYVWDAERRDFRLKEVSQAVYEEAGDDKPAVACAYGARRLPKYAYLSTIDREQLYAVLPPPGTGKQACSPQRPQSLFQALG